MNSETPAEWVHPDALVPWPGNPRKNDDAVAAVADSITRWGWGAVILARRENGEVIAGHTRLKAARSLGLESVPVRYLDLTEAEAHALALADNRVGELADWSDGLDEVLRELEAEGIDLSAMGWSADELEEMLVAEAPAEPPSDEAPELPEVAASVVGGVYELGAHRLVCGDSTDPDVWDTLLDGEKLRAVWTDPPYGVAYVGGTKDALTIQNDDLTAEALRSLLFAALGLCLKHCRPGAAWYVAAPDAQFYEFATVLREFGVWRWTLQWVKNSLVMGRADYHHRHEPILYGWAPGAAHYFTPERTHDTVFEVARPSSSRDHPTMKPVELVTQQLRNSTKPGWLVGEPFGGSGTTLMACASLGLKARLIELDPKYCDVIRRRWTLYAKANDLDPGTGALE